MAYNRGIPVGRIAGIINRSYNNKSGTQYARFGWVDFVDDAEVSKALFRTFESWALLKGVTRIHGPLGFTDFDREGMLVEGFNEIGSMATLYNYEYYPKHLSLLGYVKDVDWIQFDGTIPDKVPERLQQLSETIKARYQFRVLKARSAKELLPYAEDMFDVLNESYSELYGVVPLTKKQIAMYIKQYFGFIRAEYVKCVLDRNDKLVGFAISIPSLSIALQRAKGRLLPFGFIHILRALRKNKRVEMNLIGIRPQHHGKGVTAMIFSEVLSAYIAAGFTHAMAYPQLENNFKVLSLWKSFSGRYHIRRRCFVKDIG
jgi:hypothetical protein